MTNSDLQKMTEQKPYTIQQLSNLTGVKPVTLRAWESRYGLLEPERSESRYRMYGQSDVDTILRVRGLIDKGITIKLAAEMVQDELETLGATNHTQWDKYIGDILQAVARLDPTAVEDAYHRALAEYPIGKVLQFVITPLLQELGRRWERGENAVAEEHFFSVYLRNQLGAQFHHFRNRTAGKPIIAACFPGEFHEIGLLIFSLAAQAHGYNVIVLGANMPIPELASTIRLIDAKGIVLSGSIADSFLNNIDEIEKLVYEVEVPIMIGGIVSTSCIREITSINAISLGLDIDHALYTIDEMLKETS